MSVNADIARIDELYPDKKVKYTYIGMISYGEDEPLTIYFNESVGNSTITEPWDSFDRTKYEDRITNFDQLVADMTEVVSAGVARVEKVTPAGGVEVFAGITHTAEDVVEGQWAIYQGKVYVNPKYPDVHVEWFERIGLPTYGHAFDRVTRGTFALEGDILYVARNSGAGSSEDLLDQQNRLAEKILYTIKSNLSLNDLSEYKVTAKTAASKDVGNWAISGGKLYAQQGNLLHSLWFENIGLPHYGKEFDAVARGWYELKDGELQLVVYNEGYPEHVDVLFSNADRIADRVMTLEGVPEVTDIQLYEVAGANKKRIGQKLTKEGTMEKISYTQMGKFNMRYTDGVFLVEQGNKEDSTDPYQFKTFDEYEFIEFLQEMGESTTDIQEIITMIKEDDKVASLMKYAGNDYLRFDAGGTLRISLDKLDLLILPEIEKLKNSEGAVETKIAKAKEIALAAATEKLADIIDLSGVSISFGSLELSDENMDWDSLLTPEEGE